MKEFKSTVVCIWLAVLFFYVGGVGVLLLYSKAYEKALYESRVQIEQAFQGLR